MGENKAREEDKECQVRLAVQGDRNTAEEGLRVDKKSPGVLMLLFLTANCFILQHGMFEYVPSSSVTVNTPASDWGAIQEQ